jgi:hypothetical protein
LYSVSRISVSSEASRTTKWCWGSGFFPTRFYLAVEFVRLVVKTDGGLVPVHYNIVFVVERHHIIHRGQIRLDVAYHDFHVCTVAVVDFNDRPAFFWAGVVQRRVVMKPNIGCGYTRRQTPPSSPSLSPTSQGTAWRVSPHIRILCGGFPTAPD